MNAVNKIAALLFVSAIGLQAITIGLVAPQFPNYGELEQFDVSEDIYEVFDEMQELTHELYHNAGVNIAMQMHYSPSELRFLDLPYEYRGRVVPLVPDESNVEAIEDFYKKIKLKKQKMIEKYRSEYKIDAIMYAKVLKTSMKNALKKPSRKTKIKVKVYVLNLNTGASPGGKFNLEIMDLRDQPEYDIRSHEVAISAEFLKLYKRTMGTLEMTQGASFHSTESDDEETEEGGLLDNLIDTVTPSSTGGSDDGW